MLVVSASAWEMGEPLVTYWAGPGFPGHPEKLTDRAAVQLKDCGFNMVWTRSKEELDVAARHGLRALYDIDLAGIKLDDPKSVEKFAARIDAAKEQPALYLYHHTDEPPATKFAALAQVRQWLLARDPAHGTWLNLLPTYANNKQLGVDGPILTAYREHVKRFGEVYQPDFYSYDHYQFSNGGDGLNYFLNLAIIRENAVARGIPFINGVQACTWVPGELASPSSPRIPTQDEMRYLVYTTLANGAQGIYYYVFSYPKHRGSIANLDGTPGPNFPIVKDLNRVFVRIAKELRPYTLQGVYLQGRHAPGTLVYGKDAILDLSPKATPVELKPGEKFTDTTLVSRFTRAGSPDRFMVVNLDYCKDRTIAVTAPAPLERFDDQKGVWLPAQERLELNLVRGGGVLLRLANIPVAARLGWKGREVVFLGDSITDARHIGCTKNYWGFLAERMGFSSRVYGVNGCQMNNMSVQIGRAKAELGDNVDAVFIFAGTNDFNGGVPLGELFAYSEETVSKNGTDVKLRKREPSLDPNTFYGRLNKALLDVKSAYPKAQVILLTPVHRAFAQFGPTNVQPDERYANTRGLFLSDYVDAIKTAAPHWSVPVIDLYAESGFLPLLPQYDDSVGNPKTDRLHPNTVGHDRLSRVIEAHLRALPPSFR